MGLEEAPEGGLKRYMKMMILYTSSSGIISIFKVSARIGDKIYFKWDWGDGTFSEWLGPYESEEQVSVKNKWSSFGFFNVKVKVRDEHMEQSLWSDSISVFMPKHAYNSNPFFTKIVELFPNILKITRTIELLI